jgi:hypothetical protein
LNATTVYVWDEHAASPLIVVLVAVTVARTAVPS